MAKEQKFSITSIFDTSSKLTVKKTENGYFYLTLETRDFSEAVPFNQEQMTDLLNGLNILI